jgi:DNA-binding beta-propeller fold protein YncE
MNRIIPMILTAATLAAGPSSHASGFLLVANKGEHTLGIVDPVAGKQIAVVQEDGVTGHEVVASADGKRAFVPIYGNSGVGKPGTDGRLMRVIDIATHEVTATVDFGKGVRPHCAVIGPKNGLLYVTTELLNGITVIDPDRLRIMGVIPTGQSESHMLTISSDGRRGYTANVGPGTVSVLDMEASKVITIISVCKTTQRIAISTDDKWVFTSDQDKPRLAVIDTAANVVSRWIDLPGIGYGAAVTPDGNWLVIALPRAKKVAVVDLKKMETVRSIDVPRSPQETLVNPDGSEAYVSCDASRKVAVISTQDWIVSKLIDAGAGVDGLAWAKGQ